MTSPNIIADPIHQATFVNESVKQAVDEYIAAIGACGEGPLRLDSGGNGRPALPRLIEQLLLTKTINQ